MFASPTIALLIKPLPNQEFSEIYILGPNKTFENIPFNITEDGKYLFYLGVGNDLGYSSYYTCYLKIGNATDSLPNTTLGTPSTLPALTEYKTFLQNGATWQAPLTFQIEDLKIDNGTSEFSHVNISGADFPVNCTSSWDANKQGYYYNLIIELWSFNSTLGTLQFDNRFVSLKLNMTL